jgi:hypothetical protein
VTLSDEQETRLQILKDLDELTTTKNFSGTTRRSTTELLALADWVMYAQGPDIELDFGPEQVSLEELVEPDHKAPRVIIHKIEDDGLPDMENYDLTNRVAFIFDGSIVSGWPLKGDAMEGTLWEADTDVGRPGPFSGVTHWVEFPVTIQELG